MDLLCKATSCNIHFCKNFLADEDHIKRLQKEFEQKRKELLLEAENVVRMREEAYNQELLKLQTELEKHRRLQKKDSGASSTVSETQIEMLDSTNQQFGSHPDIHQKKNCSIQ